MNGRPFIFTGRHMLLIMVSFFGVVIAVNITLAVLANASWSGLVARNGYVASIDFAQDEAARRNAAARGWTVNLAAPDGIVTLEAHDADGAPLPAARTVTVEASGAVGDTTTLALGGMDGRLSVAEPLPPGRYVLRADIGPREDPLPWRSVVLVEP